MFLITSPPHGDLFCEREKDVKQETRAAPKIEKKRRRCMYEDGEMIEDV